jgi:hypothetical protein
MNVIAAAALAAMPTPIADPTPPAWANDPRAMFLYLLPMCLLIWSIGQALMLLLYWLLFGLKRGLLVFALTVAGQALAVGLLVTGWPSS